MLCTYQATPAVGEVDLHQIANISLREATGQEPLIGWDGGDKNIPGVIIVATVMLTPTEIPRYTT